jgi:uracil-DNA glycosylase family 4
MSFAVNAAAACGNTAKPLPPANAVPIRIGFIGPSRFPRLATKQLACWYSGWLRVRTARIAPAGLSLGMAPVLHDTGFASQPNSVARNDGMQLKDCWISAVVRCAPPDNAPKRSELKNCAPYLDEEISLLTRLRVVVCLGRIAFDGYLQHLERTRQSERKPRFKFSHGAEFALPGGRYLIASFHPSLQNTNTGRLTRSMLFSVFDRARAIVSAPDTPRTLRL